MEAAADGARASILPVANPASFVESGVVASSAIGTPTVITA